MDLYRVFSGHFSLKDYSKDNSAPLGGRWNVRGQQVVYTNGSFSGAVSRALRHNFPGNEEENTRSLSIVQLYVPQGVTQIRVGTAELPIDWTSNIKFSQEYGQKWLDHKESCILVTPSALSPHDFVCILNPEHQDFQQIRIEAIESVTHDIIHSQLAYQQTPDLHDVFICHASEDKSSVVEPLISAFKEARISYWYDKNEIKWGDSLIGRINIGLRHAKYVIVVLSTSFLKKRWAIKEWESALSKEIDTGKIIVLPLMVGTKEEREDIKEKLTIQNDKLYIAWNNNPRPVVDALLDVLTRAE